MNKTDKIFKYCKDFSSSIIRGLQKEGMLKDAFICGSVSRYEALPMSDVDIMYFGKNKKLKKLSIDEIDRIDDIKVDTETAEKLLTSMSPEAGFLDSKPICGSKYHKYHRAYNDSQYLLNKFIWEYHYRFLNERSNDQTGYNLKYSVGAYRDILLVNLFARFLNNKKNSSRPEILQSIEKIKKIIKYDYKVLLEGIATVMITKCAVLLAHASTDSRGRTQLNNETLKQTFKFDKNFADYFRSNKGEFWKKYLNSRKVIKVFLDKIHDYINENHKDLLYDYIKTAVGILNGKESENLEEILDKKVANYFPVLASIIFNKRCSSKMLSRIVKKYSNDPSRYYTNRLVIKSIKVDFKTLRFLLENSKFALDDWTNKRYKKIILNKLKNKP